MLTLPHATRDNTRAQAWINKALGFVTKDGTILELGSGFGRDALYMQAKATMCSAAMRWNVLWRIKKTEG